MTGGGGAPKFPHPMVEKTRTEKTRIEKPGRPEKARPRAPARPAAPTLSYSRINAILLGAAAGTIALGYLLLSQGSMNLAPLLLAIGYCVLLPLGIIKK